MARRPDKKKGGRVRSPTLKRMPAPRVSQQCKVDRCDACPMPKRCVHNCHAKRE